MKRILLLTVAIVALAVGVAACGGDDDSSAEPAPPATPTEEPAEATEEPAAEGGSSEIPLLALEDGSLAYDTTELSAETGDITIAFSNPSGTPHNVAVEGEGIEEVLGEVVTNADAPITVSLEPGTYTFFCSVPGHRQAGMEGTITVS
jgi:plastocyanin